MAWGGVEVCHGQFRTEINQRSEALVDPHCAACVMYFSKKCNAYAKHTYDIKISMSE